jgi:hypothetical protein
MATLTIRQTWNIKGIPTSPASITLGIVEDDNQAVVVAAGTAMTQVATGVYEYTAPAVNGGTTYTATIVVTYSGETYTFVVAAAPDVEVAAADYPGSLVAARNQCAALLVQITLNQKPSYRAYGRTYSWTEYQALLARQIEDLNRLIAAPSYPAAQGDATP